LLRCKIIIVNLLQSVKTFLNIFSKKFLTSINSDFYLCCNRKLLLPGKIFATRPFAQNVL